MARSPVLSEITTDELESELRRRLTALRPLIKKRERMLLSLEKIEVAIERAGGLVQGRTVSVGPKPGSRPIRRKRADGSPTLHESMYKILRGKTMSVAILTQHLQKAGFPSKAPTFRVMVNQALIKHTNMFKKVSHGKYTTV